MKTKIIFNMKFAGILMQKGHRLINTLPNPAAPRYNMFVFAVDDTLEEDFRELQEGGHYGK